MKILPTGTCFEDVTHHFIRLLNEDRRRIDDPNFVMVHGICLLENGKAYSHAWIEDGTTVHFPGILVADDGSCTKGFAECSRADFHDSHRVQDFTRYTYYQAMRAALDSGDQPPPWEPRYLRLCRDFPFISAPRQK